MPSPFPHCPPHQRGTTHSLVLSSPALEGNPWNDPSQRELHVYTPAGWSPDEQLPGLVVLAPFAGTGESMLARGLSDIPITTRFDRLIADGCPRFVAALPDGMTSVGGSQWMNSTGVGRYADYLLEDVLPLVQRQFNTSGRWASVGRSSGGFGGLNLAMRHPGTFQAVGCLAGDMGFDLAYLGDLGPALSGYQKAGGLENFVTWFWEQRRPNHAAFAAMNILAMSCCYSPAPDERVPARLPIDPETGAVRFEVLRQWLEFDPIVAIEHPEHQQALRGLELLFLDAGKFDEYHLQHGLRRFVRRLDELQIPHVHEEFDGGHRGTSYRYDRAIPVLIEAILD